MKSVFKKYMEIVNYFKNMMKELKNLDDVLIDLKKDDNE